MTQRDVQDIGTVEPRAVARVVGRVVAVQVEPSDAPPAFTVRLEDRTGRLEAVFMGRREVPGITPGITLEVEGCVCATESLPRLYNPRYELAASA
ncbi:DNA-binding protein [Demequina lignilytica]|uniref:DNA-binding protein n=1 Tax=Demequina lignilytica TaxID=3051663 RepID=A0AAW7M4S1_9MICO|nr:MULTISPECIES: DNA-binding protein [unclassified Demequina]MDN4482123.1 DNA-binding protein [Demequina sp. SYSU T0a273]MDN4486781.1 DNA-binding protein [Demequina sp. SYSU T00039]MDN4489465.1 DNA-binding protein [Demequina sp. SYSU T00068]